MTHESMPIQDQGAEAALLGSMLWTRKATVAALKAGACEDWFSEPSNRAIFRAIQMNRESGTENPHDLAVVRSTLKASESELERKGLDVAALEQYAQVLKEYVPSRKNFKEYIDICFDTYLAREMVTTLEKYSSLMRNYSGTPRKRLALGNRVLNRMGMILGKSDRVDVAEEVARFQASALLANIEEDEPGKTLGWWLPLRELTRAMHKHGVYPGNLCVVMGKTGSGKTALGGIQFPAYALASRIRYARKHPEDRRLQNEQKILFVSCEMSGKENKGRFRKTMEYLKFKEELGQRILVDTVHKDMNYRADMPPDVKSPNCMVDFYHKLQLAAWMKAYEERQPYDHEMIGAMVIDYAQLINVVSDRGMAEHEALKRVALRLKNEVALWVIDDDLRREYPFLSDEDFGVPPVIEIPVVLIAQMNLKTVNEGTGVENIQGSSDIAQAADSIIAIFRVTEDSEDPRRLVVLVKYRHGQEGEEVRCIIDEFGRIVPCQDDTWQEWHEYIHGLSDAA